VSDRLRIVLSLIALFVIVAGIAFVKARLDADRPVIAPQTAAAPAPRA